MRPEDRELDDEIRGHLALEVQQRIDRGEDPETARLNALRQFGYVPRMREEMRRVWYSRWFDMAEALVQEMRVGLRSLLRAKGLAATVVITLALGIGANAAIFSVVRGVLMRPLVNRGEDLLVYIGEAKQAGGVEETTFSVPEVKDFRAGVPSIEKFGEFSTIDFTMNGLGEPRVVHAGVVNGEFFDVMGLKPALGRLIEPSDDGLNAAGVAVLTYRFWTNTFNSDPSVIGKVIRLDKGNATVIGVLEPSIPYPAETEIIANMIASPHHMGAMMITLRVHRMTQLFGRLKPEAALESVRAELNTVHATMVREHPESYSKRAAQAQMNVSKLRDQIAAPARTILLLLLAAAGIVFIIACSNVANLILARSVRREGELAVRAALGASKGALRRTLLAESLVLCGAGAALGVLLARPMMSLVAQFAARFSVRALEVTVDSTLLWVGVSLAMIAAVLLAYVPKLPASGSSTAPSLASGSIRITPGTNRRLRVFATTQIAFSFVMLAGAATLLATLISMQTAQTGLDMRQVLVADLPAPSLGLATEQEVAFYQEMTRRIGELPGVDGVSLGATVPWRDKGLGSVAFSADGFAPANGEELPRARIRIVSSGFFEVLGVPMYAGRDFNAGDRRDSEPVVIVTKSFADRMFAGGDAINRKMWWVDPFFGPKPTPRRIIGIVSDVDDQNVVRGSVMAVYHPLPQFGMAGRLFVHASGDPYALVPSIARIVRSMSATQPFERAKTLEDVRTEVLAPQRINAFVSIGFAGVALLIAVVGVAGVLAFGVSARTREFGVRLAIGSTPADLLKGVLSEGVVIVSIGIAAGAAFGYAFAGIAASYFDSMRMPGVGSLLGAAGVLVSAAVAASLMPAARASRVDVLQALRSE